MLIFSKYDPDYIDNELVHIDPAAVVSVVETRRRPPFVSTWRKIAVVTMADGTAHQVCDATRQVAAVITQARAVPLVIKKEES